MPSLGFKKQFARLVKRGLLNPDPRPVQMRIELGDVIGKRQTIRTPRKIPILPYDTLYFFTGMRTKDCVRLGQAKCKQVLPIEISANGICLLSGDIYEIPDFQIPKHKLDWFAQMDGFKGWPDMLAFFCPANSKKFCGQLIVW